MPLELLSIFYNPSITQFLTCTITFCLNSTTRHNRNSQQKTVRTAEKTPLPSIGAGPGSGQATLFRCLACYTMCLNSFLWLVLQSPPCKKIKTTQQFIFSGTKVSLDLEKCHLSFFGHHQPLMSSDAEQTDPQTSPCHLNSHTNPILTSGDYLHHWSWQHTRYSHISACNMGRGSRLRCHLRGSCEWKYSRDLKTGVSRNHCMLISISYQGCWRAT